jgi:prevent-host-death family protein
MSMREVQSADASANLAQLLAEVERGETILNTRHGRAIARLVPETTRHQSDVRRVKEQIAAFRRTMPPLNLSDILSARHEGHKY